MNCPHCEPLPYDGTDRHAADCPRHVCHYGPFTSARVTGEPSRKCVVPGCRSVSLDSDGADGHAPWETDTVTGDGWRVCAMTVELPADLFPLVDGAADRGRYLDHAIDSARESAPDWCSPCEWSATWSDDDFSGDTVSVLVTRTSKAGPDRLAAEGAARVAAGDAAAAEDHSNRGTIWR